MKKICCIFLFSFCSCSVSDKNLKDYFWKYDDGLHLGDELIINTESLKNDTIYLKNKPKYFIKTSIGYFGFPTELIIKDIESGEEGRYVGK